MQSYSPNDLDFMGGDTYILPFDLDVKDEEIVEKTISLFSKVDFYEKKSVSYVDGEIQIKCLYEGKEEYYDFTLQFKVFRLKYDNNERLYYKTLKEIENNRWMVCMRLDASSGPLLEELIELKSLPPFLKNAQLEDYTYNFF
jgi:hypothetical protein